MPAQMAAGTETVFMPRSIYRNSRDHYGFIARALHWMIALAIIALYAIANIMKAMEPAPLKWQLYDVHKSIGVIVLGFVPLRIVWRFMNPAPELPAGTPGWQRRAASLNHILLYLAILVMPLSAYAASKSGDFTVNIFGFYEMPDIVAWVRDSAPELIGRDKTIHVWGNLVHEYTSYMLYALAGLHLTAALWHHYVWRDGVLARMMRGQESVQGASLRSQT